jgi:hypothetical protein
MKTKSGFRGLQFFLATCASVASACVCVLLVAGQYHVARFQLDTCEREHQGWEAFRQTNPAYFEANQEAATSCQKSLKDAQDNFWVKIPETQVVALFVATGLASAVGGYVTTWLVVWLIGAAISRFTRWLALCFERKPKRCPASRQASARASARTRPPLIPYSGPPPSGPDATVARIPRATAPASVGDSTVRFDNQVTIRRPTGGSRYKIQQN